MAEDFQQQFLEALVASSSGTGNGPTVENLLLQLGNTDPRARLIAQYLAQRQAEEVESETSPDDGTDWEVSQGNGKLDKAELRAHKRTRSLHRLCQMVKDMYVELEDLRERNDTLATALGACYLCWGGDPDCEVCHGRGRPGSSAPDSELFAQLVAPAVCRLQAGGGMDQLSR